MTIKSTQRIREIKQKIDVIYGELETVEKNESKMVHEYDSEELEIIREAITNIGDASDSLEELIYNYGEIGYHT